MPELPEVNTKKLHFDRVALNKKIEKIALRETNHIFRNISGEAFAQKVKGRQFTSSYRRGKYLFARLDNGHDVLFHFGMTGEFYAYDEEEQHPKHERFAFLFPDGQRLGFDCPRKLAHIYYLENKDDFIREKKLGEDALVISEAEFLDKMEGKTGTIKGFFLNQSNLAGMGNLYADEVCWQVRIHPASLIPALDDKTRKDLYRRMQAILRQAIANKADYAHYPDEWLWNHRHKDGTCPRDGHRLERGKVASRSTYYCPECQELKEFYPAERK
ncbi:MAG: DNA-(apurinic or apyrimidinic site) lyase [Lewinellaceae bacterium]|nr:DNA-(apurinic or apyrimidinic site) lyase [Phaeodactylibacter sp.]MCB9040078.1 DNA-(apurinic or apyrimidinic site) lyase [Lewinellaceae bacterium]